MQNGDEASPSISPAGRGQLVKMLIWYILKKGLISFMVRFEIQLVRFCL